MELTKFPSEIIDLPSEGYFYPLDNPLSSGKIEIKYMTAREEDILTSKNLIQKGVVIDTLLKSLIVSKINYNDLLIGDKNAVLIASRILAYGKDYEVQITCPHCSEKFQYNVDLSTFENKNIDTSGFEKGSRLFSYQLPHSKIILELRLATHSDEQSIESEIKSLKKISNKTGIDNEITTRLRTLIVSVNGDGSRESVNKFVNNDLLSKDSFELRKFLRNSTPDIDMSVDAECSSCGQTSNLQVPLTVDFFWPTGRE